MNVSSKSSPDATFKLSQTENLPGHNDLPGDRRLWNRIMLIGLKSQDNILPKGRREGELCGSESEDANWIDRSALGIPSSH
jgi:hypothetical protein